MKELSIGQLARRAGVAIDTVRYYERNQLLAPAGRLASGYRRYGDHELKRLLFIRRAKALGFTLADIRELLSLSDQRSVPRIKKAAEARLTDIERRLGGWRSSSGCAMGSGNWWRRVRVMDVPRPARSSMR